MSFMSMYTPVHDYGVAECVCTYMYLIFYL